MEEEESIVKRINTKFSTMSRGQRKLAEYILSEYDKAAFLTAAEIGKQVGVSESTVVRFAGLLGYKGYPYMQKALEQLVYTKLHEAPAVDIENENISGQEVLEQILKKDIQNISMTLENTDRRTFDMAVEKLLNARHVYLVGIRGSEPLAVYMGFYLKLMLDEVTVISNGNTSDLFEGLMKINEEDCLVGISFPRYSMRTLKAMEFANDRQAKIITITDTIYSPMCLYSSCNLLARSNMVSIVDSLVAPLSLINALVVALCLKRPDDVKKNLESLGQAWDNYQVYLKDEFNYIDESLLSTPLQKEKEQKL